VSKTADLVERLLQQYERCRNSDTELIIGVLHLKGLHLSETQRDILRSVNLESIRRTRQKLQEAGKYLPSPAVAKKRRLKSYVVQQNITGMGPGKTQELITQQP
jgi:hypothetical protein